MLGTAVCRSVASQPESGYPEARVAWRLLSQRGGGGRCRTVVSHADMEACGQEQRQGQGEGYHSLVEMLGFMVLLKSGPPKQDRQE